MVAGDRGCVGRPPIFIANNQPPLPFSKKVKGYVPNPTNSEFYNTVSIE